MYLVFFSLNLLNSALFLQNTKALWARRNSILFIFFNLLTFFKGRQKRGRRTEILAILAFETTFCQTENFRCWYKKFCGTRGTYRRDCAQCAGFLLESLWKPCKGEQLNWNFVYKIDSLHCSVHFETVLFKWHFLAIYLVFDTFWQMLSLFTNFVKNWHF